MSFLKKILEYVNNNDRLIVKDPYMKNKIFIYLSGSTDEKDYRHKMKQELSSNVYINILDPLAYVFPDEKQTVTHDMNLIKQCDILIAYIEKFTCGTLMEIFYAKYIKKQVFVITDNEKYRNDIWLKYHTDKFFSNIENCIEYLKQLVKKEI